MRRRRPAARSRRHADRMGLGREPIRERDEPRLVGRVERADAPRVEAVGSRHGMQASPRHEVDAHTERDRPRRDRRGRCVTGRHLGEPSQRTRHVEHPRRERAGADRASGSQHELDVVHGGVRAHRCVRHTLGVPERETAATRERSGHEDGLRAGESAGSVARRPRAPHARVRARARPCHRSRIAQARTVRVIRGGVSPRSQSSATASAPQRGLEDPASQLDGRHQGSEQARHRCDQLPRLRADLPLE